jgi:hypothetical protein
MAVTFKGGSHTVWKSQLSYVVFPVRESFPHYQKSVHVAKERGHVPLFGNEENSR